MAYQSDLGNGQTVFIEQQGEQTSVQVHGDGQSQGSGFHTGHWTQPPRLYRSGDGLVLELRADETTYHRLNGTQVQSLGHAPDLNGAEPVELREVKDGSDDSAMKPMEKMKPMEPMKPMKPM